MSTVVVVVEVVSDDIAVATAVADQHWVPEWIRQHSPLWKTMLEGDEGDAGTTDQTCREMGFQVCAADCADALGFYRVFKFWCVPLSALPLTFWLVWFQLPQDVRDAELDIRAVADDADGKKKKTKKDSASADADSLVKVLGGTLLGAVAHLDDPDLLMKVPYGEMAAMGGVAPLFRMLIQHDALKCALVAEGRLFHFQTVFIAIEFGALKVLKHIHPTNGDDAPAGRFVPNPSMMDRAIKYDQLEVVKWILGSDRDVVDRHVVESAKVGSWPVFSYLIARSRKQVPPRPKLTFFSHHHSFGNLTAEQWCVVMCMHAAAESGQLVFAQRLMSEGGFSWDMCGEVDADVPNNMGPTGDCNICAAAARLNKFDFLRWAKSSGCPWDQEYMRAETFASRRIREWIEAGAPSDDCKAAPPKKRKTAAEIV